MSRYQLRSDCCNTNASSREQYSQGTNYPIYLPEVNDETIIQYDY
jgi:hypothetical protein